MASDSGEATLPDPVPPHQRGGWGRGGHPSAGVCGLIRRPLEGRAVSEPGRAYRRGSGASWLHLFLCVPSRALQKYGHSIASGWFLGGVHMLQLWGKKKKNCRVGWGGQKATPFPPPLIIGGAGVTQAAATGAYKDLCAGKGIRLQPRTQGGGEARSHRPPSLASGHLAPAAGASPPAGPRDPRWLAGHHSPASGLGRFARSRKSEASELPLGIIATPRTCRCRNSLRKRPNGDEEKLVL